MRVVAYESEERNSQVDVGAFDRGACNNFGIWASNHSSELNVNRTAINRRYI